MAEDVNTNIKLVGMLGFARRAGKVVYGFDAVLKDITAGKTKVVVLSSDASPRTSEKIKGACYNFRMKLVVLPITKEQLGRAIGRDDIAVAAVYDRSFAERILELARENLKDPIPQEQIIQEQNSQEEI